MIRFLLLFPQFRNLASKYDELSKQVTILKQQLKRATVESITYKSRLEELAIERNALRNDVRTWEQRYIEKVKENEEILKKANDWQAISTRGVSMFDLVRPAPAPNDFPMENLARGPKLAREVIRERTEANARAALNRLGIQNRPAAQQSSEDLVKQFRQEQQAYLEREGLVG